MASQIRVVETFPASIDAAHRAMTLVHAYRITHPAEPLVAVFDIDATLIRDSEDRMAYYINPAIVKLHEHLHRLGAHIYIVTARPDVPDNVEWTKEQLRVARIPPYDGLFQCPVKERDEGPVGVGRFKARMRKLVKDRHGVKPIVTVGDSWTDLVAIRSESDLEDLDRVATHHPYAIIRPNDGICRWGLKLRYDD